jgi:uncharacterized protein YbaR (Trm112 family)
MAPDALESLHCPSCGGVDLVGIQSDAIADELLECRSCKILYEITYAANGTPQLVPV